MLCTNVNFDAGRARSFQAGGRRTGADTCPELGKERVLKGNKKDEETREQKIWKSGFEGRGRTETSPTKNYKTYENTSENWKATLIKLNVHIEHLYIQRVRYS